jgi:cysteinyl-tRNA synthetase
LFSKSELESLNDMFRTFNQVLAIIDFDVTKTEKIPKEINKKLEERNKAKSEKNFELADSIRDELTIL